MQRIIEHDLCEINLCKNTPLSESDINRVVTYSIPSSPAAVSKDLDASRISSIAEIKTNDYIAVIYDDLWWLGQVSCVNEEQQDAEISFLHPHGPGKLFAWPEKEDICCVPLTHMLCRLRNAPEPASSRKLGIGSVVRRLVTSCFLDKAGRYM